MLGLFGGGKFIFIEIFGGFLINKNYRVVVLVVDLLFFIIGGLLLGDKICMIELLWDFYVYIRLFFLVGILGKILIIF